MLNLTIVGQTPNVPIDSPRTWNTAYALFNKFDGDPLNRAVAKLTDLQVYTETGEYRPMVKEDLSKAVHDERSTILFGHAYRVYIRYQKRSTGCGFRFNGIQVIDKLSLTGPRANTVKVGEIDLNIKPAQ